MAGLTLAVGNETLLTPHLITALRQRCIDGQRIHVVVPAGALRDGDAAFAHSEHVNQGSAERPNVSVARWRLQRVREQFAEDGFEIDGEVGDPDALVAVMAAVERLAPDEVVLSTLARRRSRWLARDLPTRLQKALDIPLVVITAPTTP